MTTGKLSTSAAVLALIAGLGGAAIAQDAPQAQTTQSAAADEQLPEALTALNLTDIEVETKRDGIREIEGRTADGVSIEAKVDMAGNLIEVEADDGVLPQSLIDQLVPQAGRDHEFMGSFAQIDEIKLRPQHVEVGGRQQNGDDIEARFDSEGALIGAEIDNAALPDTLVQSLLPQSIRDSEVFGQFATIDEVAKAHDAFLVKGDDATGKDMGAAFDQEGRVLRFGREGDRPERGDRGRRGEHRGHDHGFHGDDHRDGPEGRRGDGPRGEGRRGEDRRGDGPRGEMHRMAPPPSFDAVAVNQSLTEAGYTNFGFMRVEGPGVLLEATNPQGEAVTLELGPEGDVVRETAR